MDPGTFVGTATALDLIRRRREESTFWVDQFIAGMISPRRTQNRRNTVNGVSAVVLTDDGTYAPVARPITADTRLPKEAS